MLCPHCNANIPDDAKFCPNCGKSTVVRARFCPKCGTEAKEGETYCSVCGTYLYKSSKGKSPVIAGILALLLGGLGIHRFYLGQIWLGILYLVFCWTYVPTIIGVVEGIYWLVKQDEFLKKYG